MNRNEKITLALTATIVIGSTAVFALNCVRSRRLTKIMDEKLKNVLNVDNS